MTYGTWKRTVTRGQAGEGSWWVHTASSRNITTRRQLRARSLSNCTPDACASPGMLHRNTMTQNTVVMMMHTPQQACAEVAPLTPHADHAAISGCCNMLHEPRHELCALLRKHVASQLVKLGHRSQAHPLHTGLGQLIIAMQCAGTMQCEGTRDTARHHAGKNKIKDKEYKQNKNALLFYQRCYNRGMI